MRLLHRCLRSITALLILLPAARAAAQSKPALAPEDYGQWESLGAGTFSPDGKVFAYTIGRVEGDGELRIQILAADDPKIVPQGGRPVFSSDSRYLGYTVGGAQGGGRGGRGGRGRRGGRGGGPAGGAAARSKIELMDLTLGRVEVIEGFASFSFSPDGARLTLRGRASGGGEARGTDLVIRDLATGVQTHFGGVAEFAWREDGSLLAMIVDTESQAGNGVQVFDPASGALRTLESERAAFKDLIWDEESRHLAYMRAREDDSRDGETHVIVAWRDLGGPDERRRAFDPGRSEAFPPETRIVDFRALQWSDDGEALFFGVKAWEEKSSDERGREEDEETADAEEAGEENGETEVSDVQIWHSRDERIIPMQEVQADRDRRRNYLAAWHIEPDTFAALGNELNEEVSLLGGQKFATGADDAPYAFEGMFGRRYQDVYLIDVGTGEREKIIEKVRHLQGGSPNGDYVLYFKGEDYWTYGTASGRHVNITGDAPTNFANVDYDYPVEQFPPHGVAGWTESGDAVILYDKHDLWRVSPDGAGATRLTGGAEDRVRHRLVRLDSSQREIDPDEPFYLSLFGMTTKQTGYARTTMSGRSERLIFEDKSVGRLARAAEADAFAYTIQAYDDSPDYFIAAADLADARQITATNSFQDDYAWGRSEVVHYETALGRELQGALFYPAGYEEGETYPMIVYVYEIRSNVVHNYINPSATSVYNTRVFTSQGYFVLQPDIVFRGRDPGVSSVECVEAAVKEVLAMGMVDADRVGLVGHSWGGYESAFIPTQTDIFAAAIAGAPLTNFFSMYGAIHWNQGLPETSHWETGQARMDVPYWVDFDAYTRNSPAAFINELNTPMMVVFGDADGTVDWHQGVEFYNFARRAGKQLVMLVYPDENHSLRDPVNQRDYQRRILAWFGHYLKGEDAEPWITEGESFLDRDKRLKGGGGEDR